MTTKYKGSFDDLTRLLSDAGIVGTWSGETSGRRSFRSDAKGVLNYWPSTGTIQLQGDPMGQEALKAIVFPGAHRDTAAVPLPTPGAPQIFIVHGHDTEARDQLELALRRLGLEPYVLMTASGGGKTIIEALEGKIGRDYSSDFGIVLMTPDDFGYSKADKPEDAKPRARQNVVLETGMLLASLTRQRMGIVVKGIVELPSDLQGIIRFEYNGHIREVVPKLCQRLKDAGFEVDSSEIAAAMQ